MQPAGEPFDTNGGRTFAEAFEPDRLVKLGTAASMPHVYILSLGAVFLAPRLGDGSAHETYTLRYPLVGEGAARVASQRSRCTG